MAKDLRGLFSNNRRRETNAVTSSVPFILEPADLREGTAAVQVTSGDYTTLSIPSGCIVTQATIIVEEGAEYGASSTAAVKVGSTELVPATAIDTAGITIGSAVPILVSGGSEDVVITMVSTGTSTENSVVKVVVEYTDYDRATMSYIGEE